jgi:hypothetical protein
MECPFCNAELEDNGPWGYLASHQSGEVLGYIFKCPNAEGFDDEESAMEYLFESDETLESLGLSSWEELTCPSSMHNVSGSFYTDKQGELHEGYPC